MSHRVREQQALRRSVLAMVCLSLQQLASAGAPRLYSQPTLQSPVRGAPDDLLQLVGDGLAADDQIAYAESDRAAMPRGSTGEAGLAPIVSADGAPYQLVIRLPVQMLADRRYYLWVVNSAGQRSNSVPINDARPLWFSPALAYSRATIGGMPRQLKVVGRNLLSKAVAAPALRLVGKITYELRDGARQEADADMRGFAVTRLLPPVLAEGTYQVQVQSDTNHWATVADQVFEVRRDPAKPRRFVVGASAFGHCSANDGKDDTACVRAALAAAHDAGGGVVIFGPGTWDLNSIGLQVHPGIDLQGAGPEKTTLLRHDATSPDPTAAEFVLLGQNRVRDIGFSDANTFGPTSELRRVLQLGIRYNTDEHADAKPAIVSDIEITNNLFRKTNGAIVDGGSALRRLFITQNHFGDYRIGLDLSGNRFNVRNRFGISDSVIARNVFAPGSYIDVKAGQGAMASELGASRRVDFSYNVADGTEREFLNGPDDPSGWRAGFFWHMNDSHEMLLISRNEISCSGDKAGDGEAISLDNNANTFGLPEQGKVLGAGSNWLSLSGPLRTSQNSRAIEVGSYYVGHWLRIDSGPGIGQSRRIVSYRREADGSSVRFVVSPDWDVPPRAPESTASIARNFWQTLIIANTVEQRAPPCLKSNRTRPKGGNISLWAQSSDSVIEGNRQFDSDGILFQQGYGAEDPGCAVCDAWTTLPAFVEIRGNLIDGEYRWDSSCSLSGIMGSYAAAPSHSSPPLLSVGLSIAHNRIRRADGLYGGAIDIVPTWYRGRSGYSQPLLQGIIIHHNEIAEMSGPAPRTECNYPQPSRVAIRLQGGSNLQSTVLYRNTCEGGVRPLRDDAASTRLVCDDSTPSSCECPK